MRSVLLRSIAVIGVGGLILAGVLYIASTVDARPPAVLEVNLTQPTEDDPATGLITTSLEIVFSEPVEQQTAARALSIDPAVDGAVSWSGSTMIFTPRDPLELDTEYTVTVGEGISDLAGNAIAELPPTFTFRTAGRPSLVEANPADGATDVAVDEPITLTFSRLMDTASVEAELRLRPAFAHELRWSGALLEIVPTQPLRAGARYEVSVRGDAADTSGVALGEAVTLTFRTVAAGLVVETVVPADGIDGIAPTSPIAVIFDRPIDPASVSDDLLEITPDVAGNLTVAAGPGEVVNEDGSGSVLLFTPSGPLPANTTFEVALASGVTSTGGGGMGAPFSWSFTTGAPVAAVSNQITFITDRAGVANVWAMNPDGTGKRQLSVELAPVLDYAIAPDGSSLVVADGRRLVYQRPDGSDRRVLTDDGDLEFDPAYAPDGARVAFARADAATGAGLGLWEWEVGGGEPVALPIQAGGEDQPSPSAEETARLRAPRYSPDGGAIAFVDEAGSVGVFDRTTEALTTVGWRASDAPVWLPDAGTLLLTGTESDGAAEPQPLEPPVAPLEPVPGDEVVRWPTSTATLRPTTFGDGARLLAVAADGRIAYVDAEGSLYVTDRVGTASEDPVVDDGSVRGAAFAPGEPAMVVVIGEDDARASVELLELDGGRRTPLALDGAKPRWLP